MTGEFKRADFARRSCGVQNAVLTPRARMARLSAIAAISGIWAAALIWRLFSLQIANFETWQDWAIKEHFREVVVASERGPILDKHGKLMAVSVPAGSIYVRPRQVKDRKQVVATLSQALEMKPSEISAKLDRKEPFVWVKRQIPRAASEKIAALNLPGVGQIIEARRYYPFNQASSALIGYVGIDGNGLSGLEGKYEKMLHTDHVRTRVSRDAYGNVIEVNPATSSSFELPKGESLQLTIDAELQLIVDEELEMGRENARGKSAMAVMIDSDSGEVLAMSQAPALNFNADLLGSKKALHNLIAETVFEPGSIMKPIVAAAAIESGVIKPADMVNCESGRFKFASHVIKDVHPNSIIPFRDVVIRSSNIGMTKAGMRLGSRTLYQYLRGFGFGVDTDLGLPGESAGILRHPDGWAKVDVATHSFGQGMAVTPLQIVRAVSVIANGGKLPRLRVVNDGSQYELKRVISEKTAQQVRDMMYGVTEDPRGTGSKARIQGVRVGGKTGTAQKAREHGRGYKPGAYIASFVGFVDGSPLGLKKTLTLLVAIDEPNTTSIYGGTLAGPVFKRIMQRSLHLLTTRNELSPSPDHTKMRELDSV